MKIAWPMPTLLRSEINGKSEDELRPLDLQVDGSARSPIRGRQSRGACREMLLPHGSPIRGPRALPRRRCRVVRLHR